MDVYNRTKRLPFRNLRVNAMQPMAKQPLQDDINTAMSKVLAIFGATGQQGGSIVDFVLNDPHLSQEYTIRAITRDPSSPSAQSLKVKKENIQVVRGDVTDPSSLTTALKDAHTIFALTAPSFSSGPESRSQEFATGKNIADAAVANGASYIILSTLPNVTALSNNKYTKVPSFDAKADVEAYIRTLPLRSAFFAPGSFMQNFQSIMAPRPTTTTTTTGNTLATQPGDSEFVVARPVSPETKLPLIDTVGDTGKFVGAILADPDKYEGKTFCAATKLYSLAEMCRIMSEKSGKMIKYVQLSEEEFRTTLAGSPVGNYADILIEMMLYQQDFGYYGPQTEELVAWAVKNARGKVTTFEEYLEKHPIPALQ
ncbi:hypothetical protein LTR67_003769 [Exophiala xenobiotica]